MSARTKVLAIIRNSQDDYPNGMTLTDLERSVKASPLLIRVLADLLDDDLIEVDAGRITYAFRDGSASGRKKNGLQQSQHSAHVDRSVKGMPN
ncbi:hypothetical protein AB1L42_21855 [Thalassoglobus sp. JC818]|uniref:hypothetical protein n=1 Tax=Thalassoglobus sp. JC818 TaxID=3232136 RepID=UPI003458758B